MKLLEHFKELTVHPKNGQELKGLILQLAVQGKLTKKWREENPDEEPASITYAKIIGEKADLIKLKIIKKEASLLRIPEEEKIAGIPDTWISCRLGEVGDWGAGATPSRSRTDFYGGEVNWFKSGELNNGIIDYDSKEKINELAIKNSSLRLNKIGDVLIAMYGATIGKTAILAVEGATNQAVCACTPFSCISNVYLHLLLKALKDVFIDQGEGGAQPNISRVKIRTQVFALPPLDEQKAIVSIVNQLFAEVEELEQQTKMRIQLKEDFVTSAFQRLANGETATEWAFLQEHFKTFFTEKSAVKKLRESILQLAVQGKLTQAFRESYLELISGSHSAKTLLEKIKTEKEQLIKAKKIKKEKQLPEIMVEEIPYELPEGWVWCRLEDLTTITGGVTKGKKFQSDLVNTPYLRVANVQRGYLNLDIMKDIMVSKADYKKYQLKDNDLLMIEGGDPDKVGRCAIWNSELPGCIYQNHIFRVRPYLDSTMDNLYFMQFINSRVTRDYYEKCAKRTTNLASINKTQMRSTPIAFPPLEEQKAIVENVKSLMGLCDSLEEEIEQNNLQLEGLMQSCLREVFQNKAHEQLRSY